MVLPEKLSCIAIDNRGDYCAGGTAQGRIYFWEVNTGLIMYEQSLNFAFSRLLQASFLMYGMRIIAKSLSCASPKTVLRSFPEVKTRASPCGLFQGLSYCERCIVQRDVP